MSVIQNKSLLSKQINVNTHNKDSSDKSTLRLSSMYYNSPVGEMFIVASESQLVFLGYIDNSKIVNDLKKIISYLNANVLAEENKVISNTIRELDLYFNGELKLFTTPLLFIGSNFQKKVWHELCKIPYGNTISYRELAHKINKPTAYRAVANANGANNLSIIVPCHRVINSDNTLGGYTGGVDKKKYLLNLETGKNIW